MTPIERIKPEVLAQIKEKCAEYPTTLADIINQLETRDAWTRLDYIVAMDIEHYGGVDFLGNAFYSTEEVLKMRETEKALDDGR